MTIDVVHQPYHAMCSMIVKAIDVTSVLLTYSLGGN